jgi:hypothetical protein
MLAKRFGPGLARMREVTILYVLAAVAFGEPATFANMLRVR